MIRPIVVVVEGQKGVKNGGLPTFVNADDWHERFAMQGNSKRPLNTSVISDRETSIFHRHAPKNLG